MKTGIIIFSIFLVILFIVTCILYKKDKKNVYLAEHLTVITFCILWFVSFGWCYAESKIDEWKGSKTYAQEYSTVRGDDSISSSRMSCGCSCNCIDASE